MCSKEGKRGTRERNFVCLFIFLKSSSIIIPFLSSTLAKMKDILTWDPLRVRNWGSRYFLEPRKVRKLKAWNIPFGDISWQSHWAEWSKLYSGLPTLRKRYQEYWAEWAPHRVEPIWGSVFPNTQLKLQRRLQHQHFHPNTLLATSLFLACLFLNSTLNYLPLTGQVPLHMRISGIWWTLAIFLCLYLLRFLMPPLPTVRCRKCWNESDKSTR